MRWTTTAGPADQAHRKVACQYPPDTLRSEIPKALFLRIGAQEHPSDFRNIKLPLAGAFS